jgi:hypothetical protein
VTDQASILLVEVRLPEPGGKHLADHLKAPVERAVLNVILTLGDSERRGVGVASRVVGPEEAD